MWWCWLWRVSFIVNSISTSAKAAGTDLFGVDACTELGHFSVSIELDCWMVTGFAVLDSFVYTCRRLRVHMHVKSLAYDDHCVESDNEGIETLNANIPNESRTKGAK